MTSGLGAPDLGHWSEGAVTGVTAPELCVTHARVGNRAPGDTAERDG